MNPTELLATTMFSETKDPEDAVAIAHTILNRTKRPNRFGGSLEEVIFAPSQFSGVGSKEWNKVVNRQMNPTEEKIFKDFNRIASMVLSGKSEDPTGGADHYANLEISKPMWAKVYKKTGQFGKHTYFKETLKKK